MADGVAAELMFAAILYRLQYPVFLLFYCHLG